MFSLFYLWDLCLNQGHKDFSSVFSSRGFFSLYFTCMSMIYFVLLLIQGKSSFNCFYVIFLEKTYFSIELPLNFGRKTIDYICKGIFLASLFYSTHLWVSDTYQCEFPKFVLFQIILASLSHFALHFRISSSISKKKSCWHYRIL